MTHHLAGGLQHLYTALGNSTKKDDEDLHVEDWLVTLGTCMVIAASFISCIGLNLQKSSHNKNEQKDLADRKGMCSSKTWLCGMACMVLGSVFDVLALPFVPMSRVSTLGATGMIANILITPRFLNEKLTKHDLFGGLVTVFGTTIACIYGASEEPDISSDQLLRYFTYTMFLVYTGICAVVGFVLYYNMMGFMRKQEEAVKAGLVVESVECVAAWEQLDDYKALPEDKTFRFFFDYGPQFYPIVFAMFGGISGSWSVMLSKAVLIFLKNGVMGTEPLSSWLLTFAFLVPTAVFLVGQIKYLNYSLKIYRDALFILPVYQSMWISSGIISGMVFYREYEGLDDKSMMLFIVGVLVSLIGIVIMAHRESKTEAVASPTAAGAPGRAVLAQKLDAETPQARLRDTPHLGSDLAERPGDVARALADSFNFGGAILAQALHRERGMSATTPTHSFTEKAPLLDQSVPPTPERAAASHDAMQESLGGHQSE
eukprot:TRINITY_DN9449_c0_g1_i1.p1 TRINITY_DN9449_c0_g1~~TRINITY_DN9449_c0_g1_i1.p1  ORF type:complete len:486 (+),score=116.13 TRINITY_DN9449_c0_g1_i1:49-1506(+)